MKTEYLSIFFAAMLIGCGATDTENAATTGPESCPSAGCPSLSCVGATDGARCLGFDGHEQRGWAGFCVSSKCHEYVPVTCALAAPAITVTGCDGSGMVTGGMRIDFKYQSNPVSCSGVDGEFGYCAHGTACYVYKGGALVGQGVCQ